VCCRLADKGLTVVGVECSPIAIESFFNEHSLQFTKEPVSKLSGFLYKVCKTSDIKLDVTFNTNESAATSVHVLS